MPAREGRSLGELLLDSDLLVREVLMDTPLMDGRVMIRTWGEVVEAAADLWRAFPEPSPHAGQSERHNSAQDLMKQLQTMNNNLMKASRRSPWPGTGLGDDRLLTVCENLTTAAELLPRRRTDVRPMRPEVEADLDAAKARLMHVLYVGAHGVQVALNRDLRDLTALSATRRAAVPPESRKRTVEARDRVAAFEQLAGSYVAGTFPTALHGEHKPPAEPDRLRQALATWDIQAHRSLSGAPTAGTIALIAQTQAHIAFTSQTLLRAGSGSGAIEPGAYRTRLAPALESAQASWVGLATVWPQLAPSRGRRPGPDLVNAANEIRAATREIIHDRSGLASIEVLAATVDLKQVSRTLQLGLATSADLAYALRESTEDPDLLGSARGVNTMAMALEARGPYGNASTESWVRPVDHAHDRPVALPDIVREALMRAADRAIEGAKTAAGAAAYLSGPNGNDAAKTLGLKPDPLAHHHSQTRALPAATSGSGRLR
ncbi:hypothetical protein [Terrabacter sp. Ter38]|uniref:hypothetical protein n=1 Tax=Terrabacter sp. Ter38 TaxID=2926030 RepID=UPI002117A66D|nr:hypothetical protein [Terrabacter sp. Ter38]